MIIMQEFGRHFVVEPFFETVVLAAGLIDDIGLSAQREEFLPSIAAGQAVWALAWTEAGSRYEPNDVSTTARKTDDGLHPVRCESGGYRHALGR